MHAGSGWGCDGRAGGGGGMSGGRGSGAACPRQEKAGGEEVDVLGELVEEVRVRAVGEGWGLMWFFRSGAEERGGSSECSSQTLRLRHARRSGSVNTAPARPARATGGTGPTGHRAPARACSAILARRSRPHQLSPSILLVLQTRRT